MIKSINSRRELQHICNMSSQHDLMYSCIDTTSQWKNWKALSRHPVVFTLFFSVTILHYFSYLPSLSFYTWLLRGAKVIHIVYNLFPSFHNYFFTMFCFCCLFCFRFGLVFLLCMIISDMVLFVHHFMTLLRQWQRSYSLGIFRS